VIVGVMIAVLIDSVGYFRKRVLVAARPWWQHRGVSRACIGIACLGLAWALPGIAQADRVYTLQHVGSDLATGAVVHGIGTLPDGSIIWSDVARRRVVRVLPTGRRVPFGPALKGGPGNLLARPDGTVLVVDTLGDSLLNAVVRRIAPDGSSTVVAGRAGAFPPPGEGGFQEGVAATSVWFGSDQLYLADRPDGGFLLSGGVIGRVVEVHPDGTMTTAAMVSGGDIASTADGGFVVAGGTRVFRVTPDGTIRTIAGNTGRFARRCRPGPALGPRFADLTAVDILRDGSFAVADNELGCIFRISSAGTVSVLAGRGPAMPVYLPDGVLTRPGFFWGDGGPPDLAMLMGVSDIATDPLGRLLFLDGVRVGMLASRGESRTGVSISAGERHGDRLRYIATAAGAATLAAMRGQKSLAVTHSRARPGANLIRVPDASPGLGRLVLRVRAAEWGTDWDELGVVLGGRLSVRVAEHVLGDPLAYTGDDGGPDYYLGGCKKMARRRVDCLVRSAYTSRCKWVASLRLTAIGLPMQSEYACGRRPTLKPHRTASPEWPVPLR
jgi:hypothetical protein